MSSLLSFCYRKLVEVSEKDDSLKDLSEKENADKRIIIFTYFAGKVSFVISLIVFCIAGVANDQQSKYISLDPNSGRCRYLPIPLTGKYKLDDKGNWEGTKKFEAATARYLIEFNSFQADNVDIYSSFMDRVEQEVIRLGEESKNNDVAMNLALWSNHALKLEVDDTVQYFRLSGEISTIFNRNYLLGVLGHSSGDCDISSEVLFDPSLSQYTLKYSFNDYNSSSNCIDSLDPVFLGYNPEMNGDDLSFRIDMRTIMAAYALNLNLAAIDIFIPVYDSDFDKKVVSYNGDTYSIFMGIDPDYLGMHPVYCLIPISRTSQASYNFDQLCLAKIVDTFVYPHLNHFGVSGTNNYNPYIPKPCDCSNEGATNDYCNNFDLLTGFVGFDEDDIDDLFNRFLTMVYTNSPLDINKFVYNASFSSIRIGGSGLDFPPDTPSTLTLADITTAKAMLFDDGWRSSTYSFCNGSCSVITIRAYDTHDMSVNYDYFQLAASSCANDIYVSEDAFGVSRSTPPNPLEQLYGITITIIITINQLLLSLLLSFSL